MTISEAIDQLNSQTTLMPDEALQCLRERWTDAEPLLLDVLDQTLANPCRTPSGSFFCALFICAEMRSHAAFERYIKICRLTTPLIDFLINASTLDFMRELLARTCNGRFDELKALVEDESLDRFARVTSLETLSYLTGAGEFPLEALKSYYLDLLEFRLEPQKGLIWFAVILASARLGLTQALPLIEDAYANGFIDDPILPFEDVVNNIEDSDGILEINESDFKAPADAIIRHYFSKKQASTQTPDDAASERIKQLLEKLQRADQLKMLACQAPAGRNDPCPCGSGKKFKKCCVNKETVKPWEPPEPANYADQLIDCGYACCERLNNHDAFLCWNQAWREIIDTNMIKATIVDPQDPECELFDCCQSFQEWIENFLDMIIEDELLPIPSVSKAVVTIREFLDKFPAMAEDVRAMAEYLLAALLATIGESEEAEVLFNQSLKRSPDDAVELMKHSYRTGLNAHNQNLHPNWENALAYAEKALQLQDDRLKPVDTIVEYIQYIKRVIELRTLRQELAENQ